MTQGESGADPVTIEDVLRLIREAEAEAARRAEEAARRAEAEVRRTEAEVRRAEDRARRAEDEARRRSQEWDRRFAHSNALIDRLSAEAARRHADLEAAQRRTDQQIGALTGKWGRFVESLVVPACRTLFLERGIAVHEVHERVRADRGGRSMEIDILVVNDDDAVLVEVKSTLGVDDVRSHLEHIAGFREMFPTYRHHTLYGALAGIVVPEQMVRFVINQGVFLIVPSGDTVSIANPPDFRPRAW